MTGILEQLSPG